MSDPLQFDVQAVLARRISRQNRSKDAPNRSALRWDTLVRSQNHSSFISSEITLSNTFGGKTLSAFEQESKKRVTLIQHCVSALHSPLNQDTNWATTSVTPVHARIVSNQFHLPATTSTALSTDHQSTS